MLSNSLVFAASTTLLWKNDLSQTDYRYLKRIINGTNSKGTLARRRVRFSEYVDDAVHRAGVLNKEADALFRFQTTGDDKRT